MIEGHVPADLIDRLLRERPKVAGLAVAGMPTAGSPGMETSASRSRMQVLELRPGRQDRRLRDAVGGPARRSLRARRVYPG